MKQSHPPAAHRPHHSGEGRKAAGELGDNILASVPAGTIDEEIDRSSRSDDTQAGQENVSKEGFAAINHDLVAGVYPQGGGRALRVQETDVELTLTAASLLPQHSDPIAPAELIRPTGLRHGFPDRSFRPHSKHCRTTDLARY